MKNKLIEKIRSLKIYTYFRKIRFRLHLIPAWHRFVKFFKHYFGGLYDRLDRHHVFLLSGGLAFSLFVCIVPLTLIIFWILGKILDSAEVEVQIVHLIDTVIPYNTYAQFVKEIIFDRVHEVIRYRNLAGFVGIIGLFFAASGFASSLRTVLNKVFGTDLDINIFLGKLRDFLVIILVVLSFLVMIFALPLLDFFRTLAESTEYLQVFNQPIFQRAFTSLFSLFIMYLIFSITYKFMPIIKIRKRSVLIGALWASILWVTAKIIFGVYLSTFTTFSRIYGAYAFVIVIAFWIYYTSAVFIIGAEVGKLFDERVDEKQKLQQQQEPPPDSEV
ncbi:YihY/virulence factor BrkB family protein [bacterium BMS3Abin03]|nr:YihY/virulence factor BrkB family protein [bacterium BMS3Abin03]MCG6961265.1 YihY/virulence factor BrkB family protein [bacterium BMS3Abin03]